MEFVMITFNLEYFLKLLHALYTHNNKDERFSKLMTFDDFRRIGLSTNSNGNIQDYFVYHLQMLQNENLVCTFRQDRETRAKKFTLA